MIPASGNISLQEAMNDTDQPWSNGLNSQPIKDRTSNGSSGISPDLRSLAGTVTAMNQNIDYTWNTGPKNRASAWAGTFINPAYKQIETSPNSVKLTASRNSNADCGVEMHYHGRIPTNSGTQRYQLQGKVKGFGSGNAREAPMQIFVFVHSDGYLQGGRFELLYQMNTYGTFSDRPINALLDINSGFGTYITIVLYQLCYGPDHQPPGEGSSVLNQQYYTRFENIRLKRY